MIDLKRRATLAALPAAWLAACGGGRGGKTNDADATLMPSAAPAPAAPNTPQAPVARVAPSSVPAWRKSLKALTWAEVGTKLETIDPANNPALNPNYPNGEPWHGVEGFSAVITNYNGGAYHRDKDIYRLAAGGGHQGYGGNGVYDQTMSVDSPAWVITRAPTGSIGHDVGASLKYGVGDTSGYLNEYGKIVPKSSHTYGQMVFVGDDLYLCVGIVYEPIGTPGYRLFKFTTANEWVDMGHTLAAMGSMCWDSKRNQLVHFQYASGGLIRLYSIDTGTWTVAAQDLDADGDNGAIYIPELDVAVYLSAFLTTNGNRGGFGIYDFGRTPGPHIPKPPYIGTPMPATPGPSGVWVPGLGGGPGRILSWNGGTGFYTLTPPAGDPAAGTWRWGRLEADAANTVTPTAPTYNGIWGRLFYSPSLDCVGVINDTTQKTQVFALS